MKTDTLWPACLMLSFSYITIPIICNNYHFHFLVSSLRKWAVDREAHATANLLPWTVALATAMWLDMRRTMAACLTRPCLRAWRRAGSDARVWVTSSALWSASPGKAAARLSWPVRVSVTPILSNPSCEATLFCARNVASQEGWPLIKDRNQCNYV